MDGEALAETGSVHGLMDFRVTSEAVAGGWLTKNRPHIKYGQVCPYNELD